jgi:preprotein translocase subunit YajC
VHVSSETTPIFLLVALLALFWLVVLRPARRSQKETSSLQRNLAVGDDVVLSAGIFGTIRELDEARVKLEIAPGIVIEVARQVVVRRTDDLPDTSSRDDDEPTEGPLDRPEDDRPPAG